MEIIGKLEVCLLTLNLSEQVLEYVFTDKVG